MTRSPTSAAVLFAVAVLGSACLRAAPSTAVGTARQTTDGALAAGNIDSQIDALDQLFARSKARSAVRLASLADLLQIRAQYFGRISDWDRALAVSAEAVKAAPRNGEILLSRAAGLAGVHRFDEALLALDQAEKLDEGGAKTDSVRASILQARGDLDGAVTLRERAVQLHKTVTTLGGLAAAYGARRDLPRAEATFAEAAAIYRDSAPFPLAWIDFQRGMMLEREGRLDDARPLYAAALQRLPGYAQAASHLASLEALRGQRDRAEALLRPLLTATDDPEYPGQLAGLLRDQGRTAEADSLHAAASAGYDKLLLRHPDAFANHAARFFLPDDPARALTLAQRNLKLRSTWEAFDLALSAAAAARDLQAGCALATQALQRPSPPPRIARLAAQAKTNCTVVSR